MNNKLYKLMNWPRIEGIIYSEEDRPHEILGPHMVGRNALVQTFQPGAESVFLVTEDGKKTQMELVDEAGYFACLLPGKLPDKYEYEICRGEDKVTCKDAYRYQMNLSSNDIEKFNAGIHYTIYESWTEQKEPFLPYGPLMPCASAWWEISTIGMGGSIR